MNLNVTCVLVCISYFVVILPFWFGWFSGGEVNLLYLRVVSEIK